jgi:putative tryptophan/tyrosine transport system substrate-binding protein
MKRRQFIAGFGAAAAWPLAAWARQTAMPVIGFINAGTLDANTRNLAAFRAGLGEAGYIEGQNVSIEYHWFGDHFDRIPAIVSELVRHRVAVIATAVNTAALAAKAATTTIPIVFGVNDNPVRLGLVASLARPGGNLTGINFLTAEVTPKRLGLLRELVPRANRVAVLINPSNSASSEATLREAQDAARVIGLPIDILKASSSGEIESAFATMVRERIEALFIAGDSYFASRRVQFATLAASNRIAASAPIREFAEAGGLMSYGTNFADTFRQVGAYASQILKGAKPADLPVVQSTKFEFVINMQTARALGLTIPETLLATADEVIQ